MVIETDVKITTIGNKSYYFLVPESLRYDSRFPFDLQNESKFRMKIQGQKLIIEKTEEDENEQARI